MKNKIIEEIHSEIRELLGILSIEEIISNKNLTAQAEKVLYIVNTILNGGKNAKFA